VNEGVDEEGQSPVFDIIADIDSQAQIERRTNETRTSAPCEAYFGTPETKYKNIEVDFRSSNLDLKSKLQDSLLSSDRKYKYQLSNQTSDTDVPFQENSFQCREITHFNSSADKHGSTRSIGKSKFVENKVSTVLHSHRFYQLSAIGQYFHIWIGSSKKYELSNFGSIIRRYL
jgi:hypothetical protein